MGTLFMSIANNMTRTVIVIQKKIFHFLILLSKNRIEVHTQLTANNTFKNQKEEILPFNPHSREKKKGTNNVHAMDGSSSDMNLPA